MMKKMWLLGLMCCLPWTLSRAAEESPLSLEGTSWQLLEIQDLGNSRFAPDSPAKYTVRFRSEGRLQVESDCNTGGATWQQDGNTVEFVGLYSSEALCPPGSLHNRFMMHLHNVRSIVTRDGHLFLATSMEGVLLQFEPLVFVPASRRQ